MATHKTPEKSTSDFCLNQSIGIILAPQSPTHQRELAAAALADHFWFSGEVRQIIIKKAADATDLGSKTDLIYAVHNAAASCRVRSPDKAH